MTKHKSARLAHVLMAASALGLCAPALAQNVPDTKAVLGHEVGEDYYLANYEDSVRYFEALAKASDRIKLFRSGQSTHGKTYVYAVISSPENIANFDKYKAISKRLGDARGLNDEQARQLAKDSPIIVHIDGGMHASEVSDHQLPLALAHKLLSAKDDAEVDAILKNVILVLWPTLNPDGQDMVVDWYRKQRGTKWETSRTPWLYQEYVGHDNNRDGYMLNMKESQVVNAAEQEYAPVIWYSQHQVAPFPARIWVPPFADPVSSNISPYMRIWTNAIGTNIMTRMETEGKPGAIAQARFDNWYAGFLDYIHVFRNTISFFTETAHDSATPMTWKVSDFPKSQQDLKAQIMYPNPWKGGEWHLKDSVDYMVTASMSVLETAQKYRETLLFNRYQAGRDMIAAAAKDGPAAYVIPADQTDMPEAASLAQLMISHGLDVMQTSAPTAIGGQTYAAGSWVVPMDQPFAGLARELFDKQKYPDAILGGDGNPADLPYDVTGWTLPMQMGVKVDRVEQPLDDAVRGSLRKVPAATAPAGGVTGSGSTFLVDRRVNNSYRVMNAALAAGGKASWNAGTIALTGLSPDAIGKLATQYNVSVTATSDAPAGEAVRKSRVGLYRPWGSNIDEGWTRWLLEQYDFQPTSVYNADVKAGLARKYDTIVLPDMSAPGKSRPGDTAPAANFESRYKGPLASLMDGFSPNQMPAPYAGGIGEDGAAKLKDFVRNGGTLVALNNASDAVIDLFDLPVTNILKDAKSDFFFCSGALLQVNLTPGTKAAAGMPVDPIVMFERGPAFETKPGFKGEVLASYAPTGNPLRSGVLLHPEAIQGKAAAVVVEYGKGKVYLYGFRPQWRGQSHAAYKMFFNTLYPDTAGN
ncbi:MAG TPA: M14 family zinc carboxypeptidase [Novosphingobium sp.]|nr:M14 family zinc carboxypeptidase [Novosphingobium sp.]